MKLRKLKENDASNMLEWMHDYTIVSELEKNFENMVLSDCIRFIKSSQENNENLHMAIVDANDEYMGTVSLKHMDFEKGYAEFAIVLRKKAMAQGYGYFGMTEIFRLGNENYGLHTFYWCVSYENKRAINFYNKHHFVICDDVPIDFLRFYSVDQSKKLIWYKLEYQKMN